ncbi:MAG: DUF3990 domain-containing protein, partial [Treponema sp.]|nr:DUF3990 domain-containing protein [Candidatus Treponema scatequi]
EYILTNFLIDYKSYDVIKGYRADDSYFSFANAFLENTISLQKLNAAMKLGLLGEQIVLKSEKSFEQIHYLKSHISNKEIYYPKKMERDSQARKDFFNLRTKNDITDKETIFLIDIIRQEVTLNDARLQRALSL